METIQGIFVDPPIAVARLGGSTAPQDAYRWVESENPRTDGNTVIDPWWTLDVMADGSVEPRMPTSLRLRDGDLIRPVAPFFEVWALVGKRGSKRATWREVPLTLSLLKENGVDESALALSVDAKNRKAARRCVNKDLVFGTFTPVAVQGNDHAIHPLLGVSPPTADPPMVPPGRAIPLGSIQVLRARPQPKGTGAPWEDEVSVETVRFRFTPARGHFYGPPEAATSMDQRSVAVEAANAFLDRDAGWFGQITQETLQPDDTYDTIIPETSPGRSLGVVDDTCEARVAITLTLSGSRNFTAHANVFVGPPDFAPDRRPFLSIADEIDDRSDDGTRRNAALSDAEREAWVQDLFERIYETVSLFNADHFQNDRSILLTPGRLRASPIPGDHVTQPRHHAMTSLDRLRNPDQTVPMRSVPDEILPLSEHARTRHRAYQDIDALRELVFEMPKRLEALIRRPFEIEDIETADQTTMRMPPFMRNSNAFPLTLSSWQYDLLMSWVAAVKRKKPARVARKQAPRLSKEAAARRAEVLARLDGRSRR
jgi:hypothetical protein